MKKIYFQLYVQNFKFYFKNIFVKQSLNETSFPFSKIKFFMV